MTEKVEQRSKSKLYFSLITISLGIIVIIVFYAGYSMWSFSFSISSILFLLGIVLGIDYFLSKKENRIEFPVEKKKTRFYLIFFILGIVVVIPFFIMFSINILILPGIIALSVSAFFLLLGLVLAVVENS